MSRTITTALLSLALAATVAAQTALDTRGAMAMGFDQDKARHEFILYDDGGAIEITTRADADAETRDAIRAHLPHIAMLFGQGQFDLPHFIHATDVPGTHDLARLKERVTYTYRETPTGGRVDIVTTDPDALAALHAFLRFQITDHKTGDTLEVRKRGAQPVNREGP